MAYIDSFGLHFSVSPFHPVSDVKDHLPEVMHDMLNAFENLMLKITVSLRLYLLISVSPRLSFAASIFYSSSPRVSASPSLLI
jgi:hypothetical protein